ncbi:MAG TPA: hypothetical protein VJT68_02530 [Thermoleophilaceae bacterium]|nr:hypothetical protein [Thermoleophilaceae bacterium]
MTRARRFLPLVLLAVALPASSAQAAECPPGSPTLVVMVNGKTSGPVYTTRDLLVRVRLSGGAFYTVNSFDVTGLRRVPDPNGDEPREGEALGIADSPGTLSVTATLTNEDVDPRCTVSGTASFEIKQATKPQVSKLRRPPVFRGHRPWLWDTRYWFWVKPGPTGDVSPITVEARLARGARVPRSSAPAKRITFPMRPSDGERPDTDGCVLFCPQTFRTFAKSPEIDAMPLGGREVPAAVKVLVRFSYGIPRGLGWKKLPAGLDVRVIQGGVNIARLRMAGRCDPKGQFFLCRYKKLSTAL